MDHNNFTHIKTIISKSRLDFREMEGNISFKGDCAISTSIGIPKDSNETPAVKFIIDFALGGKSDSIQIQVRSESFFHIDGKINSVSLLDDAKKECFPDALNRLAKKVADLTELHVGVPLNIPIPDDIL